MAPYSYGPIYLRVTRRTHELRLELARSRERGRARVGGGRRVFGLAGLEEPGSLKLCSYGLYSYGPYSYGLYGYGLCRYGLCGHGLI